MGPIKVVIADDHTLFREGLRRILSLERDILVVGEAADGEEVFGVLERGRPDVLLLDLKMPGSDVVQTILEVRERKPDCRILILTAFAEQEGILDAAKAGARGYLLKGVSSKILLEAIKRVNEGGLWIDEELPHAETFEEIAGGQTIHGPKENIEPEAIKNLTRREVEILRLVAEGLSNEEIGQRIFISQRTVKTHLTNIFDKLKVNSRFKAALMILKNQ